MQKGGLDTAQAEERLKVSIVIVYFARSRLMVTGDFGRKKE